MCVDHYLLSTLVTCHVRSPVLFCYVVCCCLFLYIKQSLFPRTIIFLAETKTRLEITKNTHRHLFLRVLFFLSDLLKLFFSRCLDLTPKKMNIRFCSCFVFVFCLKIYDTFNKGQKLVYATFFFCRFFGELAGFSSTTFLFRLLVGLFFGGASSCSSSSNCRPAFLSWIKRRSVVVGDTLSFACKAMEDVLRVTGLFGAAEDDEAAVSSAGATFFPLFESREGIDENKIECCLDSLVVGTIFAFVLIGCFVLAASSTSFQVRSERMRRNTGKRGIPPLDNS